MTDIIGSIELMLAPKPYWELISNPLYLTNDGTTHRLHAGMFSDGGSIPPLAWPLVGHPLSHEGIRGYLLHDHHYQKSRKDPEYRYTREQVDGWMHEVHLYDKMDEEKAILVYSAVRAFSWQFWGDGKQDVPNHLLDDPEGFEWFRE